MLRNGDGIPENKQQAFHYYKQAADRGHIYAQRLCGYMLNNGDGIPANKKRAFEYFERAAAQGDRDAQYMCGEFFYSGEVVPQDKQKAFYYYNLAANQDDKKALAHCGVMLAKGDGIERNNKQALNYLQHALELENPPIPFSTELEIQKVYCYLLSMADEDDKTAAYEHFAKLAPHGTPCNQYIYAYLCQHGIGGLQNYDEALQYHTPLAKQGYMYAQFCCAQIFHIRKDLDQAYEYCQMAAKQDDLTALTYLPILEKERSGNLTESAEVEFFPLNETEVLEDNTSSSDEGDATEEQLIVPENAVVTVDAQTTPEKQVPITIVNIDAQVAPENKDIEKLTLSGDLTLSDELLICKNINMKQNLEFRAKKEAQEAEKKRLQEEAARQTRIILKLNNGQSKNLSNQGGTRIRLKRKVSYRALQFIKAIFGQGVKINTFSNEEARKIFAELGCSVTNKKGKNATILSFKPTIISCILENGQEIEMEYQAQTTEDAEDGEQKTQYHNPHGHGDNNLYQALLPHLKRYCTAIDITPDTVELEGS